MLEVTVCIGSACHIKGAYNVIQTFQQLIEEKSLHDRIIFKSGFCMKLCQSPGVAIVVDGEHHCIDAERASDFFISELEPRLRKDI